MKKVYISTPVNARPEITFRDKYKAATFRVHEIIKQLRENNYDYIRDLEFRSFIDAAPFWRHYSEPEAMGRCVQAVLEADSLIIDDSCPDAIWHRSRGCCVELNAARQYGKPVTFLTEIEKAYGN